MDKNLLRAEIIKKYGSLSNLAIKMGIAQNTLSRNLQKLTPAFKARLLKMGIEIPNDRIGKPKVDYVTKEDYKKLETQIRDLTSLGTRLIKLEDEIEKLRREKEQLLSLLAAAAKENSSLHSLASTLDTALQREFKIKLLEF